MAHLLRDLPALKNPICIWYPDLNTFEIFPWRPQHGKVARFICDVYRPKGVPFEGDSRYILKKVIKEANAMGYTFECRTRM